MMLRKAVSVSAERSVNWFMSAEHLSGMCACACPLRGRPLPPHSKFSAGSFPFISTAAWLAGPIVPHNPGKSPALRHAALRGRSAPPGGSSRRRRCIGNEPGRDRAAASSARNRRRRGLKASPGRSAPVGFGPLRSPGPLGGTQRPPAPCRTAVAARRAPPRAFPAPGSTRPQVPAGTWPGILRPVAPGPLHPSGSHNSRSPFVTHGRARSPRRRKIRC